MKTKCLRAACALAAAAVLPACEAKPRADNKTQQNVKQTEAAAAEERVVKSEDVSATWYDVPPGSLPERRAGGDEFTAAHDRLPKGTRVRVTNKKTGANAIVRITDNGVHEKGTIDLCKGAAEKIGLVGKGRATVRIEILETPAR